MKESAPEPLSPLRLLRELQSGERASASLSVAERRSCVEHLLLEGYTLAEMTELFGVSLRTVQRDVERIREANALTRDPKLVERMAGEVVSQANAAMTRIRRSARDREASPGTRIEAERAAWSILRECVGLLQSLGYLPHAASRIEADLTHRLEGPIELAESAAEAVRLQEILARAGNLTPALQEALARISTSAQAGLEEKLLPAPTDCSFKATS